MKLSLALILLWQSSTGLASSLDGVFRPTKISYEALVNSENNDVSLLETLHQVGMVSVTGIFSNDDSKKVTLEWLHPCAMKSEATVEHTYGDGTTRRTMATHCVKGGGAQQMKHHSEGESSEACDAFNQASDKFRSKVAEVTEVFANRLSSILEAEKAKGKGPFLVTESGFTFDTLASVVENGEHLEHFHSYQKKQGEEISDKTIEWHTDQGLFLAFTPGQRTHSCHMKDGEAAESPLTDGFYIELEDESKVMVEFDGDDDLVFMLGDGVNQYINSKLDDSSLLRATPHALIMPNHSEDQARVWYGRMVLPPASAIHEDHGMTFGQLRENMIKESSGDGEAKEALSLGCSGSLVARELQETTCEAGTMYCWHRCMSLSENGVNETICAEQSLQLQCINPRRQLWDNSHGDFFPGCATSDAIVATPYEKLPEYPRGEQCSASSWEEYSSSNDYDHRLELPDGDGNPAAVLMWSIVNNEIKGRLAFDGLFGFLALGFAAPEGAKNGMHGAEIIMALPGSNYSVMTGLDLSMDTTVEEYKISSDGAESAYRFWMDPVSSASSRALETKSYEVDSTPCFTALTFQTNSIHSRIFNVSGTDDLIWGANEDDFYVGYHGMNRGRFSVNWTDGAESKANGDPDHDHDHDDDDHNHDHDDSSSALARICGGAWYTLTFLVVGVQIVFL